MIAETISADHDEVFEEMIEAQQKSETGVLDELMHKALVRGYLVTDDLLAAFPEAEENMAQLEEIFIQLINQGIEVYSDAEEAEEERRLKEAPLHPRREIQPRPPPLRTPRLQDRRRRTRLLATGESSRNDQIPMTRE